MFIEKMKFERDLLNEKLKNKEKEMERFFLLKINYFFEKKFKNTKKKFYSKRFWIVITKKDDMIEVEREIESQYLKNWFSTFLIIQLLIISAYVIFVYWEKYNLAIQLFCQSRKTEWWYLFFSFVLFFFIVFNSAVKSNNKN